MNATATPTEPPYGTFQELHRGCFACGADNPGGLNLRFTAGADTVSTAEWLPSDGFCSYPERLHGGLSATLVDSAMVHALFMLGIAGVTAELSIRYAKRIILHEPLRVAGWVESERRSIYLCRARIEQSGTLCVRASAKFMTAPEYPPPPTQAAGYLTKLATSSPDFPAPVNHQPHTIP